MSDSSTSDSLAYRRELRRKKILENAELRKQKIFGIHSNTKEEAIPPETVGLGLLSNSKLELPHLNASLQYFEESASSDKDETGSTKSLESQISTKSVNYDECSTTSFTDEKHNRLRKFSDSDSGTSTITNINRLNEVLRNIPDPLDEILRESPKNGVFGKSSDAVSREDQKLEKNKSFPKRSVFCETPLSANSASVYDDKFYNSSNLSSTLHSDSGGSLLLNFNDGSFNSVTPGFIQTLLEHPASVCVLAFIVSLLLSFNLGHLISNSIIMPFFIWEIQQIIAVCGTLGTSEEKANFLEVALMLCGVRSSLVKKYMWISKFIKDFLEDFSIYMVIIVLWQVVIGFPEISH